MKGTVGGKRRGERKEEDRRNEIFYTLTLLSICQQHHGNVELRDESRGVITAVIFSYQPAQRQPSTSP